MTLGVGFDDGDGPFRPTYILITYFDTNRLDTIISPIGISLVLFTITNRVFYTRERLR